MAVHVGNLDTCKFRPKAGKPKDAQLREVLFEELPRPEVLQHPGQRHRAELRLRFRGAVEHRVHVVLQRDSSPSHHGVIDHKDRAHAQLAGEPKEPVPGAPHAEVVRRRLPILGVAYRCSPWQLQDREERCARAVVLEFPRFHRDDLRETQRLAAGIHHRGAEVEEPGLLVERRAAGGRAKDRQRRLAFARLPEADAAVLLKLEILALLLRDEQSHLGPLQVQAHSVVVPLPGVAHPHWPAWVPHRRGDIAGHRPLL
mmetsp:Transcript_54904/g.158864  ORF Transcript_54904/g.158864 Transcript_54904/m.158864 type:complete len:257 (-) Transcript_54904:107-877(-)